MELQDYVAMQELQCNHKKGWSAATALWVLVAAIIVFAIVYNWTKNTNEKVAFATSIANINGRLSSVEPAVVSQGKNLYALNSVVSASVQGVKDIDDQIYQLNREVFYEGIHGRSRGGCGCGCGNREFRQSSTYNLASQSVTVDETCRN